MPGVGFVWFDSGNEPWRKSALNIGKDIKILSTFPYKSTPAPETEPFFMTPPDTNGDYQSAQTLHKHYGEDLDDQTMGADAFYAFHGLFQFCAFSEIQFLNLMEKQLSLWRSDRDNTRKNGTAFDYEKLEQTRLLLEDHLTYLEETIEIIKRPKSPDWPVATEKSDIDKTEVAARQLLTDYTYLQHRARRLLRLYEDKNLVPKMNTSTTPYSPNALRNKLSSVGHTTLLLPILVATFFSMNFRELQDLSVWLYFPTLLLLALAVLFSPLFSWFLRHLKEPHWPFEKEPKKSTGAVGEKQRRPSQQV